MTLAALSASDAVMVRWMGNCRPVNSVGCVSSKVMAVVTLGVPVAVTATVSSVDVLASFASLVSNASWLTACVTSHV